MTAAYIIAEVEITNLDIYRSYAGQVPACLEPFSGRVIVRGGQVAALEGAAPAGRILVLEFPSMEQAMGFWESPAYRTIVPLRQESATARIFVVEGDGPPAMAHQPREMMLEQG